MMIAQLLIRPSVVMVASLLTIALLVQSTVAEEIYVSPAGDNQNDGTLASPLATIAAAQIKVRALKQKNPEESVTVFLRGGKYYLTEPVVFTSEDSGTKQGPVTFKAYKDEVPQVLGGIKLSDLKWEKTDDNVYKTKVPEGLVFETLFVNGKQQILARYPNYTEDAPAFNGVAADCLSKKRVATWEDPTFGYFHAMHPARWGGIHFQITGKKNKGEVTRVGGTQNNRGSRQHKELRYVENIFEELDDVHEWYLDRKTSELYFYPAADIDLQNAEFEVAALEQLFVFKGTEESPVQYLSIEGLTLKRTIRTFMKTDVRLLRSDWTIYRGGVVHFEGTENCVIKDCKLSDLGGNAVFFNMYNKDSSVEGCHIYDVGASGVCFVGDISTARAENYNIGEGPALDEHGFHTGASKQPLPTELPRRQ